MKREGQERLKAAERAARESVDAQVAAALEKTRAEGDALMQAAAAEALQKAELATKVHALHDAVPTGPHPSGPIGPTSQR